MKYYIDDNFRIKSTRTVGATMYKLQEKKRVFGIPYWRNTHVSTFQSVIGTRIKTVGALSKELIDEYYNSNLSTKDLLK